MKFSELIFKYRKITLSLVFTLGFLGLVSWITMPREEDPRLSDFRGVVTVIYPGSTATEMQRLVVERIEDELSEIEEIKETQVTVRSEFALLRIDLRDSVTGTKVDTAWRKVESALDVAYSKFPQGTYKPKLDRNVNQQDAFIFAITGSEDPLLLLDFAEKLEEELSSLPLVAKVNIFGDPGKQISINVDDSILEKYGLNYEQILRALRESNRNIPSGSVRIDAQRVNIETNSGFKSLEEIRQFPILLNSGNVVLLGEMAKVVRSPDFPIKEKMFLNGRPGIAIGVVPKAEISLLDFGKQVRSKVDLQKKKNANLKIEEISVQPDYVKSRLDNLSANLFFGILIVAAVLILGMGFRIGLLVALLVPVISLISLGLYGIGGGVLNQMSISAFVMALGLLIDNVIVVVEGIQEKLDEGADLGKASKETIDEFIIPLASATGTTVAAFLPMLGASGTVADFTRSIPTVAILCLIVSYFFAIFVTPNIAQAFLKKGSAKQWKFTERLGEWVASIVISRSKSLFLFATVAVAITGIAFGLLPKKFFPYADRNQLVVSIELPEGTHLDETTKIALKLEEGIRGLKGLRATATFVGRSTPRFYYNLNRLPNAPHIAQILVTADDFSAARKMIPFIEKSASELLPSVNVIVRELQQGPPVNAPIEIRLVGDNEEELIRSSENVLSIVKNLEGTRNVVRDVGIGSPNIRFSINDASAARFGLTRREVTSALLGRTIGLDAGEYRWEKEPIPIRLRSEEGDEISLERLRKAYVAQTRNSSLDVSHLSSEELLWKPSVFHHYNRRLSVSVTSELSNGASYTKVISEFKEKLKGLNLPEGIEVIFGGEAQASGEANTAILRAVPLALILFLGSLLFEFNSFKEVGIILVTIPLSFIGIVPGLLLSGNAFGFMSLIGSLALVGIVVNNGILIIDHMKISIASGISPEEATRLAIQRRIRPILLTTATTIAGMLPLAFSNATLWPPFAWSIVSGLLVSTALTLFIVPSLYLIGKRTRVDLTVSGKGRGLLRKSLFFSIFIIFPSFVFSQEKGTTMTLREVIAQSGKAGLVTSSEASKESLNYDTQTLSRDVYMPKLRASMNRVFLDQSLPARGVTPGGIGGLEKSFYQGSVEITQNLFDPSNMFYLIPAKERAVEAEKNRVIRIRQDAEWDAASKFLDSLSVRVKIETVSKVVSELSGRKYEVGRLYRFGQVLETDLLRVDLALDDSKQKLLFLKGQKEVIDLSLGQAVGSMYPVEPIEFKLNFVEERRDFETILSVIKQQRKDLQALRIQIESMEKEKESINKEALPKVFAKLGYNHQDSGQFTKDDWYSGTVGVSIQPFEGGTRASRVDSVSAKISGLREKMKDLERGIGVQVRKALSDLSVRQKDWDSKKDGYRRAYENAERQRNRFLNGKATFLEKLEADVLRREKEEETKLAELERNRSIFYLRYVMGESLIAEE
ncbi:hypothetical protein EHQ53_16230 [Leptospira langatensis]|uniref:Efflux RND transporter permease subunit n=1 Tax=Leptospira langatensis TaxID=2484983 RepID=A0A5F1ZNC4_9LEPT|nr:efflux RND transporter permease subunit [Leptospira langatensis]TGK05192.1 hypothetical protein EHO57_00475 [Leptospira langatensis]TGL38328.1 hypothetical protein EHQ53_16230 [Leptospira langatensis]